jgi:DNA-binding response OmpR family regulator
VRQKGINTSKFAAPEAWRLTSGEAAVFSALLTEDAVDVSGVTAVAGVTAGSVDVLIHRLRKKVSSHGIEIETVRGKGWRLVGRETWRLALAAIPTQTKGA